MIGYCEDYPCCGHTPQDPCDPRQEITEPWYCDLCGFMHYTECPDDDGDDSSEEVPGEEWWQPDTNAEARGDA